MEWHEIVLTILGAMSIPAGFTGLCFRRLEKKLDKKQKQQDAKEAARRKNELMIIESVNASIALGEATARAVQRIPDAKCNGDMHAALQYASEIKHKYKDFITEQSVEALY